MSTFDVGTQTPVAERILEDSFGRNGDELTIGGHGVRDLAQQFGTPLYVYDGDLMKRSYQRLSKALDGFAKIYYSVKANPNPAIARLFNEVGAGLEVASGGEFEIARRAGCAPHNILCAGPGKGYDELALMLKAGIGEVHLETFEEIEVCAEIAQQIGRVVPVALRINPVMAVQGGAMRMGAKATGFGFDEDLLDEVITSVSAHPQLNITGIHMFAGTQILDSDTLLKQWSHGIELGKQLARHIGRPINTIDLGGGLGVPYHSNDKSLQLDLIQQGIPELQSQIAAEPLLRRASIIVEPGRFLTAEAGVYLMRVQAVKTSREERFIVTDGGMHHHLAASGNLGQVIKRDYPIIPATQLTDENRTQANIIGPLCTPLDTLGRQTQMPEVQKGDLIAVLQSGAYGLTASPSMFLTHPTPAEILIADGMAQIVRSRGTFTAPIGSTIIVN